MEQLLAKLLMVSGKGGVDLIVVKEAIIVEGKYDKIKLSSFIDGMIIETRGFRIFKDKEQMALIRKMADARGLLILTDSDSAGFLIRNYLKSCIARIKSNMLIFRTFWEKSDVKHLTPKKENWGVEGIEKQLIIRALEKAGVVVNQETISENKEYVRQVTKQDFFEWGLTGRDESNQKRKQVLKQLKLPEHLTTNAMIDAINSFMSYEAFLLEIQRLGRVIW